MRLAKLKSAYYYLRGLSCETSLQEIMGSCDVFRFDIGFFLQGQTRIGKFKSGYRLLIIGPTGLQCETKL